MRSKSETTKYFNDKGLSIAAISRMTGIHYGHLQAVFSGFRSMADEKWALVAEKTGVPLGDIPRPTLIWEQAGAK